MKLNELSNNLEKITGNKELNKYLDKINISILKVIRGDPHYYKDKDYAKKIVLNMDKIKK